MRARAEFPILTANPELVYLDSAATSQKPRAVLDAVQEYLTTTTTNANAGRGTHPWANRTTDLVEQVRERVKSVLGDPAPDRSTVHFTGGTTEGLRTVARDWLARYLGDGDEILVPFADHRANLEPWLEAQRLLAERGTEVRVRALPRQVSGDYDHRALADAVGPRTPFVAATHVHHVYGGDMNVHRVRAAVGPDVPICLDAAQSVGHLPLRLGDPALDVDFVAFSGHKALALPGAGAVWARNTRGPALRPPGWQGTPNTVGAASLLAAFDWLDAVGVDRPLAPGRRGHPRHRGGGDVHGRDPPAAAGQPHGVPAGSASEVKGIARGQPGYGLLEHGIDPCSPEPRSGYC